MEPLSVIDLIHEAIHAQPFRPFILLTKRQRRFSVPHPDRALIVFNRRAVAVADAAGTFEILDLTALGGIQFLHD